MHEKRVRILSGSILIKKRFDFLNFWSSPSSTSLKKREYYRLKILLVFIIPHIKYPQPCQITVHSICIRLFIAKLVLRCIKNILGGPRGNFFCFIPLKISYELEWMGLNFYDYDGLQPKSLPSKVSAGSVPRSSAIFFYRDWILESNNLFNILKKTLLE